MNTCRICNNPACHETSYCEYCLNHYQDYIKIGLNLESFQYHDLSYKRRDKHATFLEIAQIISKRSPDSQTQHGCVLVKNDRVVATGCNGWNAGSDDLLIPNIRPAKYRFVIHAELNAILNAAKEGVSIDGATAYITGRPCTECAKALIQCNIKEWFIGKVGYAAASDPTEQTLWEFLVRHHGVQINQL